MAAKADCALNVISQAPLVPEKFSTAIEAIKSGLHNVKVSRIDADKVERNLQGELFDKWEEKCEVMKATKIPSSDIMKFLDHMVDTYEGINDNIRRKMEGVLFVEGTWEYKLLEYKFNVESDGGAKYGLIAFGKSPDKKFYDCMYVLYHMDFKLSRHKAPISKQHSILWGLISWTTTDKSTSTRKIGTESTKSFQNFFRVKALQGFYKEGVIESINYVDSIDNIPE